VIPRAICGSKLQWLRAKELHSFVAYSFLVYDYACDTEVDIDIDIDIDI
jgi:hypothetical protein